MVYLTPLQVFVLVLFEKYFNNFCLCCCFFIFFVLNLSGLVIIGICSLFTEHSAAFSVLPQSMGENAAPYSAKFCFEF